MPHLTRNNFDGSFLNGRMRRGVRNGVETFEEVEEGEQDENMVWAKKPKTSDQAMIWSAEDLYTKATVQFEKYLIFKDLICHAFYLFSIPLTMWLDGGMHAPTGRFLVPSKVSLSGLVLAQLALGCYYYAFNEKRLFVPVRGNNLESQYNIALLNIIWITCHADLNVLEGAHKWSERVSCLDTMTTDGKKNDLRLGSLRLRSCRAHII